MGMTNAVDEEKWTEILISVSSENIETAGKLSKKTILVISEKGTDPIDKEKYGKIARL